jgi:predicted PurR-regulated permease PerM
MTMKNSSTYLFIIFLLGVSVLAYFIVAPFIVAFVMAALVAQIFYFVYKFLLKVTRGRRGLSSAISCLLVALGVLIPASIIISLVVGEIGGVASGFAQNPQKVGEVVSSVNALLARLPLAHQISVSSLLNQDFVATLVQGFSKNALAIIGGTYLSVFGLFFSAFIFFFSLVYLFMDGAMIVKKILEISPVKKKYQGMLVEKFSSISRATVRGTLLVAAIQGAFGAVLFFAIGVSSPILLGILMAIASVIPPVGSGLVWFPAGVILILSGDVLSGVIVLVVGAAVIGTIDNVLRPKLIGQDTKMHPVLILFSTLGGIIMFGMAGFLIGPLVMALCLALWEIYLLESRGDIE